MYIIHNAFYMDRFSFWVLHVPFLCIKTLEFKRWVLTTVLFELFKGMRKFQILLVFFKIIVG